MAFETYQKYRRYCQQALKRRKAFVADQPRAGASDYAGTNLVMKRTRFVDILHTEFVPELDVCDAELEKFSYRSTGFELLDSK